MPDEMYWSAYRSRHSLYAQQPSMRPGYDLPEAARWQYRRWEARRNGSPCRHLVDLERRDTYGRRLVDQQCWQQSQSCLHVLGMHL
eukprot:scaffold220784_cov32-Tisochrysis_lutea.AAC.3